MTSKAVSLTPPFMGVPGRGGAKENRFQRFSFSRWPAQRTGKPLSTVSISFLALLHNENCWFRKRLRFRGSGKQCLRRWIFQILTGSERSAFGVSLCGARTRTPVQTRPNVFLLGGPPRCASNRASWRAFQEGRLVVAGTGSASATRLLFSSGNSPSAHGIKL